jgi:hypothetical protein
MEGVCVCVDRYLGLADHFNGFRGPCKVNLPTAAHIADSSVEFSAVDSHTCDCQVVSVGLVACSGAHTYTRGGWGGRVRERGLKD